MRFLVACFFIILVKSTTAQEISEISCRFFTLEGAKLPPPLLIVSKGGNEVPCEVFPGRFSDPVKFTYEGDTVQFLAASGRTPVATAKFPKNIKNAILMFIDGGGAAGDLQWKVYVIEDSLKNLPPGGAFIANFNPFDIRFIMGEHKVILNGGTTHSVNRPTQIDNFSMGEVKFQTKDGENWKLIKDTTYHFAPGIRYLIFCYTEPSGQRRVVPYRDSVPVAPAAIKTP